MNTAYTTGDSNASYEERKKNGLFENVFNPKKTTSTDVANWQSTPAEATFDKLAANAWQFQGSLKKGFGSVRRMRELAEDAGVKDLSRRELRGLRDVIRQGYNTGTGTDTYRMRKSYDRRYQTGMLAAKNKFQGSFIGYAKNAQGELVPQYSSYNLDNGDFVDAHSGIYQKDGKETGAYWAKVNGNTNTPADYNYNQSLKTAIDSILDNQIRAKINNENVKLTNNIRAQYDRMIPKDENNNNILPSKWSSEDKNAVWAQLTDLLNQNRNNKMAYNIIRNYMEAIDPVSAKNITKYDENDLLQDYKLNNKSVVDKLMQSITQKNINDIYELDPKTNIYKLKRNSSIQFKKEGGMVQYAEDGAKLELIKKAMQRLAVKRASKKKKNPSQQDVEAEAKIIAQQIEKKDKQTLQELSQEAQELQNQTPMAKLGKKLSYIQKISSECPEGEDVVYFHKNGGICKKCMPKAVTAKCGGKAKKACGGSKVKKAQEGAPLDLNRALYLRQNFIVGTDSLGNPIYTTGRDIDKSHYGYQLRHEQRQPVYEYKPLQRTYMLRPETSDEAIERKGGDRLYEDYKVMDAITRPEKYYDWISETYKIRPDWDQESADQEAEDFRNKGIIPFRILNRR